MAARSAERLAIVAICGWFVVCALAYRRAIPMFEGQDEIWHVLMAQALGSGQLPVAPPPGTNRGLWDQVEAAQPPLYYLAVAPFLAGTDLAALQAAVVRNPHGSQGGPGVLDNKNLFARPPEGSAAAAAVDSARLVSIGFGLGTVLITYLVAQVALPDRPGARVLATAAAAFLPGFVFISALVTNDAAANFFGALVLYFSLDGERLSRDARWSVCAGLALGCLALSKTSGLLGFPLLLTALLVAGGSPWRRRLFGAVAVTSAATLVAGWWYARNLVLYGELTALRHHLGRIDLWSEVPSHAEVIAGLEGLELSFVGVFGWFSVRLSDDWYRAYSFGLAVGALGGVLALGIWTVRRRPLSYPLLMCAAWVLAVAGALIVSRYIFLTFHGRLLYPCLPALAVLWARGMTAFLPRRLGLPAALAATIALGWSVARVPADVLAAAYAIPPLGPACTQAARSPAGTSPIELVGTHVDDRDLRAGDPLTVDLCWRARSAPGAAWSVFAQLVDPTGRVLAQHDGFPGGGNDATLWWSPGSLHEDRHHLVVPSNPPVPVLVELRVGLYDVATGRRVPGLAPDGGDTVSVRQLRVVGEPPTSPTTSAAWPSFDNGVRVVALDLDPTSLVSGARLAGVVHFAADNPSREERTISVQLVGPTGLVAQQDGPGRAGLFPIAAWRPGDAVPHAFALPLPLVSEGSRYRLDLVLYDPHTGRRAAVGGRDALTLARLCAADAALRPC